MPPQNAPFKAVDAERSSGTIIGCFKGMSGSGKTLSALYFARGLVGPDAQIALIDTEGGRGLQYADDPELAAATRIRPLYRYIPFYDPPFSSERFTEAVKAAVADGAKAIIIDSESHEHEAEGGMLWFADQEEERLRKADKYGNDPGMRKWIKPKMEHNRFIRYSISCNAHIIFCVRQTQTTEMQEIEENGRKKKKAVIIINDVAEKNLEFDMDIVIELERETHRAKFIKVPKPYLSCIRNGEIITIEHGARFAAEAMKGKPGANPIKSETPPATTTDTAEGARPELPRDLEIHLAKGDPLYFAGFDALHAWMESNIPKVKTLDVLNGFMERNKPNFDLYSQTTDAASEWMELVNEIVSIRKKELTNGN